MTVAELVEDSTLALEVVVVTSEVLGWAVGEAGCVAEELLPLVSDFAGLSLTRPRMSVGDCPLLNR
jgi:hypothetical protein